MKLCPQCDFIYEDDQRFCDMDGKELVHDSVAVVTQANAAAESGHTPKRQANPRSRSIAIAVVFGVVIVALVTAGYFVRARQLRSRASSKSSTQSLTRSAEEPPTQSTSKVASQPSESESVATPSPAANSVRAEQVLAQPYGPSSSQSKGALSHSPLTGNPVTTREPSGDGRGSVIVRLNNGAAIKADEAWEKKEGVWYRQAGMVTFLKRSRVRTIERVAAPATPSRSTANRAEDKSRRQNSATQNQLRLARLEPVGPKKQSRVSSFLKKTGQILKKPFKF